ncbi:YpoC family protein [Falsibacillus pallidus]|uniref:YpoC family protein n=1 Tax=Falsibacillus pallidus TaxID=493781 RepID=UPI003D954106
MIEKGQLILVPNKLQHPFFYAAPEIIWPENKNEIYFFDEFLFFLEKKGDRPWTTPEVHLPLLNEQWKQLNKSLQSMFAMRARGVKPIMVQAICTFFKYLFWANGEPVVLNKLDSSLQGLKIKPVNIEERLFFMMESKSYFHAYKQLSELFNEQTKQTAKHFAMRKLREK